VALHPAQGLLRVHYIEADTEVLAWALTKFRPAPILPADPQNAQKEADGDMMSTISARPASSEAFASNSWTFRPAVLKRWWVVYLNWRLRQTAIAELAVLSDRELKDIGLKRGEIENAVTNTLKRERAFNR
jgi:uncharacterized protein YjiS (DUF1127 family)